MYNGHFTIKPKDKKLLKSSMAGCNDQTVDDRAAWDALAQVVADYVAPVKHTGMWIEVHETKAGIYWQYTLKRKNGKGQMTSGWYKRRIDCVNTAQRTAKALGIVYREL